jgi:TolB protein
MHISTVRAAVAAVLLTGLAACSAQPGPAVPAPAASTVPDTTAPASAPASPSAPVPAIGPLYYFDPNSRAGTVQRWDGAGTQPVGLPAAFRGMPANANVSPDGHWGSFIDDNDALRVVDLHTGQIVLTRPHADADAAEPAWAPDSRHLLVGEVTNGPEAETIGVIDVTTGAFVPLPHRVHGIHLTWSVDGTAIAYADGEGKIFTAAADGSDQRAVPGLGDGGKLSSFDLESAGPGAARIALWVNDGSTSAGDVARGLTVNAVVNSRTGQRVSLAAAGGSVVQVLFRGDGSMVVRVQDGAHHRIVLLSVDGAVLSRVDEPDSLGGRLLLTT